MEINANFDERAVVHAGSVPWVPSPMAGVERRMLDRIGDEVARATSIVRYAPQSHFAPHTHGGGEEFFVLDGVFQDEHGDFPAGSYVRNPPQSRHTPGSTSGCTIFVKLWQFDPGDRNPVRLGPSQITLKAASDADPVAVVVLHHDAREKVTLEHWPAGASIRRAPADGIEILCLEGTFAEGGEEFTAQSWLRLPVGTALNAVADSEGCSVWVKEGHLAHVSAKPPAG